MEEKSSQVEDLFCPHPLEDPVVLGVIQVWMRKMAGM
jgi:hypothetical protein